MDNRKGTSQPGRGHNPHHSAIGEPGSRRQQPNDPQQKRNQNTDVDDDQMDDDRDEEDQDSMNRGGGTDPSTRRS